jgi:hypothetical protein
MDPLVKEEQQVLFKALSKKPEERYPDCLMFVHALERAVAVEMPAEGSLPAAARTDTRMRCFVNCGSANNRLLDSPSIEVRRPAMFTAAPHSRLLEGSQAAK